MSEIDRLAKLLAKNLRTDENVTTQGDIISFDGERLENSERSTRERVHRKERRYKDKKKVENPVFATIVLLVTVERDEEYELYILSENYSALKEGQRWWEISYVKSLPKYFTGAPWYAWGFPGFLTEGTFSDNEYGFIDSIPSKERFGFPFLMETKTLDVNQQLGISSPLFFDDNNPAPVTKTKASFSVTDLWFSGFFRDNYVEITHLYEDRYGNLSFAAGREIFPNDWWIYPYFSHDVDIEHTVSDGTIDVYRYAYSADGSPIDFDSLSPEEYTTVTIPLYELDGITKLPIVDGNGNVILGTSNALALDEVVVEEEWRRTDPETCEEVTGLCVAENQTVESELRDFGVHSPWNVSCFNNGNVLVEDEGDVLDTIAVSMMPVNVEWSEIPDLSYKYEEGEAVLIEEVSGFVVTNLGDGDAGRARVSIVGIPDTLKPAPSSVEAGVSTTTIVETTAPVSISTQSVNEIRFRWSSESESETKEINASTYYTGIEYKDGADFGIMVSPFANPHSSYGYNYSNVFEADPNQWVFYHGYGIPYNSYQYNTIDPSVADRIRSAFEALNALPPDEGKNCNNAEAYVQGSGEGGVFDAGSSIPIYNGKHCYYLFNVGRWFPDGDRFLVPRGVIRSREQHPYVVFDGTKKYYAPNQSDTFVFVSAGTDTNVVVNGSSSFYANGTTDFGNGVSYSNPVSISIEYETKIEWTLQAGGSGSDQDFGLEYANYVYGDLLKVFQNGIQLFRKRYEGIKSTRLTGIQNITEYKLFVHTASISFTRTFGGITKNVFWYKRGEGSIDEDVVTGDCNEEGKFFYGKTTKEGKLGVTTITEQDSDRGDILYKFIGARNNGDEVLDEEVTPELSITYVHAGGKVFSAVHTAGTLNELSKPITDSPNHQYSHIRGVPKISIGDLTSDRTIAAPYEGLTFPTWEKDDMPPGDSIKRASASTFEEKSIGETLLFVGTFESVPTNVGGAVWRRLDFSEGVLPIEYEDAIEKGDGIQWSNHHEYFVPRKREYWGTDISGGGDEGKWLNGWEPINTVGLTGYLPSGEFRSFSLYHETTQVKLQYGIKGAIETVQGVNKEPLHFVFAYGGIYAAFGKVNNGVDDDEKVMMLKSPAGNDLTQLLLNKQLQTSNNPPYPAEHDLNLLMKSENYTWGGFKNYICPYTPGLAVEVNGLSSQVPLLMYPIFSTGINTSGIESTFEIGVPFVDPESTYTIAVNSVSSVQTGISTTSALRSAFLSDLTGIPGVTIASSSTSITFTGQGLSISVSGLDLTIDADDEPTPNITATVYFPGINAPYALEIDGTPVGLSLSNGMDKESALSSLLNSLSDYDAERVDDRIVVRGVYEVKQTIEKDYNDLTIVQTVEATESTDRPWRETEIKWDYTPEVGVQTSSNLELLSTANVSKYLKYQTFDYSVYPYAKIEDNRIFSIHNSELLGEPQPNKLLDQDFLDNVEGEETGNAIVVKYAKTADTIEWKEITVQVKKIQASWFGATRDEVNIIAIAPSVISMPGASALVDIPIGIKEDYEEP